MEQKGPGIAAGARMIKSLPLYSAAATRWGRTQPGRTKWQV